MTITLYIVLINSAMQGAIETIASAIKNSLRTLVAESMSIKRVPTSRHPKLSSIKS
jgi:hypothetical protein